MANRKQGGPQARWARGLKRWRTDFDRCKAANAANLETRYEIEEELALLDLLLERQIAQAEEGDCTEWRKEIHDRFGELCEAIESGDDATKLLTAIRDLVKSGYAESRMRDTLRDPTERLARLKLTAQDSQSRRDEVVTRKQAVAVFQVWLGLLRVELDPQVFARLAPRLLHVTEGIGIEDGKT